MEKENYYLLISNNSYQVIDGVLNNPERELLLDVNKLESLVSSNKVSFYYDGTSEIVNELASKLDAYFSGIIESTIYGEVVIVEPHENIHQNYLIPLLDSLING